MFVEKVSNLSAVTVSVFLWFRTDFGPGLTGDVGQDGGVGWTSVRLLPGAQVQLDGEEGVSVPQTGMEHVKVCPPHSLQVVLQHHRLQEGRRGGCWNVIAERTRVL